MLNARLHCASVFTLSALNATTNAKHLSLYVPLLIIHTRPIRESRLDLWLPVFPHQLPKTCHVQVLAALAPAISVVDGLKLAEVAAKK